MQRLESSPLETRPLSQQDADWLYGIYPNLPHNHRIGCPACGKNKGINVDGVVTLDGVEWQCNCRDQLQRHKHYLNAGIGSTYQYLSWHDYHGDVNAQGEVEAYLNNLDANIEEGRGLILSSNTFGNGKTFMATMVAKAAVLMGYDTYFTTFPDLLSNLKAGWKDGPFQKWYTLKVDSAQILVLDDVGKEYTEGSNFNNGFAIQTFDALMRTRVQQGRVTILTTNLSNANLRAMYHAPVMSLLDERETFIVVNGTDYRKNAVTFSKGNRRIW